MEALTAIVVSIGLVLLYKVLIQALRSKGDVRAGGNIGGTSFYLEVKDRKPHPLQRTEWERNNQRRPSSG